MHIILPTIHPACSPGDCPPLRDTLSGTKCTRYNFLRSPTLTDYRTQMKQKVNKKK